MIDDLVGSSRATLQAIRDAAYDHGREVEDHYGFSIERLSLTPLARDLSAFVRECRALRSSLPPRG